MRGLGERRVTALLGPTNTGKTHRAIQRMLGHKSGMIGLPLRLLAREVYDKVVRERGPECVALITGEEKRIPPNPRYFVCTVEAMPVDRAVAFVAVDEVQLAADRNRGHVFTDRLLHARGVYETLFMGSDTIAPILEELLENLRFEKAPRLSKLTWSGTHRVARLPSRTALVAFSAAEVYRHAERLRSLHGGVAVVMGALSPRTRNAQVALYESGAVQHIVATDAIGMGLNMDIRQVCFAGLRKFDGHRHRELSLAEMAQIAGRAGRHTTDGQFGALREVGALEPEEIDALETHRFPALTHLWWRNSRLDFSSVEALLASLRVRPGHRLLKPARNEDDERVLEELGQSEELPLGQESDLRTLWEVCRIPDYRKTRTGTHTRLLHDVARDLLVDGEIDEDRVAARLDGLDRTEGDLETLMARIAFVRTWTYVSHQRRWLRNATHWQQRTREIEDRLSDALHERLRQRFVDAGAMAVRVNPEVPVEVEEDEVRLGEITIGVLRGLSWRPATTEKTVLRAARQGLRPIVESRLEKLLAAKDDAFEVDLAGQIWWRDGVVGKLARGADITQPDARAARLELITVEQRERIRTRLASWVRARTDQLLQPLGNGRGLNHESATIWRAVRHGLGSCPLKGLPRLDRSTRTDLEAAGIHVRNGHAWHPKLLTPSALAWRSALYGAWTDGPVRLIPGGSPHRFPLAGDTPEPWLRAVGYVRNGTEACRVDRAPATRKRRRR